MNNLHRDFGYSRTLKHFDEIKSITGELFYNISYSIWLRLDNIIHFPIVNRVKSFAGAVVDKPDYSKTLLSKVRFCLEEDWSEYETSK